MLVFLKTNLKVTFYSSDIFIQSTLNLSNPNFFSVWVDSVSCRVFYMKTVIGTEQQHNVTALLPLSDIQVNKKLGRRNFHPKKTTAD